ncbi:MAG: GNAT family N-acetyltransferase [Pyrinomonadaceae bacterium]|nr:GNAT family N-acetyltransferase [Pyrinomonadaceae bacterium]MBP6214215.1 GNAT family N-acetyltransferase [Pyrinomonadaceae bacterium]
MVEIRKAEDRDKPAIWQIIKAVIAGGDTYVFAPDTSEVEMMAYWFTSDKHNYVGVLDGGVVATFWLRANQLGLGAHVANAAYMVSPNAQGKGIGKQIALWSLGEANRLGFTAMQFNFVVKSNEFAVRLWQKLGFEIVGEIPDVFKHSKNGLTNAYIMYRKL